MACEVIDSPRSVAKKIRHFWNSIVIRRIFQIKLRTLLLLMGIIACSLAFYVTQVLPQVRAVNKVKMLGGSCIYKYQVGEDMLWVENPKKPGPAWLRKIIGDDFFVRLIMINIDQKAFTNDDLKCFQALKHLYRIDLDGPMVDDESMKILSEIDSLQELHTYDSYVGDEGLRHVSRLKNLKRVSFGRSEITDEGLSYLASLPLLERVYLLEVNISNQGLIAFQQLKHLQELQVHGDGVDAGILEILPGVEISCYGPSLSMSQSRKEASLKSAQ